MVSARSLASYRGKTISVRPGRRTGSTEAVVVDPRTGRTFSTGSSRGAALIAGGQTAMAGQQAAKEAIKIQTALEQLESLKQSYARVGRQDMVDTLSQFKSRIQSSSFNIALEEQDMNARIKDLERQLGNEQSLRKTVERRQKSLEERQDIREDTQKREREIRADEKDFIRREKERDIGFDRQKEVQRILERQRVSQEAKAPGSISRVLKAISLPGQAGFILETAAEIFAKNKRDSIRTKIALFKNDIKNLIVDNVTDPILDKVGKAITGKKWTEARKEIDARKASIVNLEVRRAESSAKDIVKEETKKLNFEIAKMETKAELDFLKSYKSIQNQVDAGTISSSDAKKQLDSKLKLINTSILIRADFLTKNAQKNVEKKIIEKNLEVRATKNITKKFEEKGLPAKGITLGNYLSISMNAYRQYEKRLAKLTINKEADYDKYKSIIEKNESKLDKDVSRIDNILKSIRLKKIKGVPKSTIESLNKARGVLLRIKGRVELRNKELDALIPAIKLGVVRSPGRAITTATVALTVSALSSLAPPLAAPLLSSLGVILFTGYGAVQTYRLVKSDRILTQGQIIGESIADIGGALVGGLVGVKVGRGLKKIRGSKTVIRQTTFKGKEIARETVVRGKERIGTTGLEKKYPKKVRTSVVKDNKVVTVRTSKLIRGKNTFKINEFIRGTNEGTIMNPDGSYIRFTKRGGRVFAKFFTKNDLLLGKKSFRSIPKSIDLNIFKTKYIIKTTKVNGTKVIEIRTKTLKGTIQRDFIKITKETLNILKKTLTKKEINAVIAGKEVPTNIIETKIIKQLRAVGSFEGFAGLRDIKIKVKSLSEARQLLSEASTAQKTIRKIGGNIYFKVTPSKIVYVLQSTIKGNKVIKRVVLSPKGAIQDIKFLKSANLKGFIRMDTASSLTIVKQFSRIQPFKAFLKQLVKGVEAFGKSLKGMGKKAELQFTTNIFKNNLRVTPLLDQANTVSLISAKFSKPAMPKLKTIPIEPKLSLSGGEINKLLSYDNIIKSITLPAIIGFSLTPQIGRSIKEFSKLSPILARVLRPALITLPTTALRTELITSPIQVQVPITKQVQKISLQEITVPVAPEMIAELNFPGVPFIPIIPGLIPFFGGRPGDLIKAFRQGSVPLPIIERFYYTPDLYSKLFNVRASAAEREKLLRVGRIFTGLSTRKIV